MKADISRATFRSAEHFPDSVVMQQGRVQVDADWNKSSDVLLGLDETTRVDTIGPARRPEGRRRVRGSRSPPDGADLLIGAGPDLRRRLLLCERGARAVEVTDLQPPTRVGAAGAGRTGRCNPADWIVVRTPQASSTPSSPDPRDRMAKTRTVVVAPALTTPRSADANGPPHRVHHGAARSCRT